MQVAGLPPIAAQLRAEDGVHLHRRESEHVEQEIVGMQDLDPVRFGCRSGKILQVQRDDGMGVPTDRRS
ncbi:hypothetical protein [Streptomyces cyaneofuscatus]|uniref:hypothetical protein n=1 Tax=Streptomyces cyaneofuscatus TaxID=66883 RepID=UPI00363B031F